MIDILIESKYCFIVAFVACFLYKDVQAYSILVSEIYLRCVDFLNDTIVLELIFYDSNWIRFESKSKLNIGLFNQLSILFLFFNIS